MNDLTHLIGRLLGSVTESGGIDLRDPGLLLQAADALQSLTARVAELETKASLQWSAIEGAAALNAEKMRRIADLEAALKIFADEADRNDRGESNISPLDFRFARAALNPVEGE